MTKSRRTDRRDHILQVLANKFLADPERFRSYLPELVPEIAAQLSPAGSRGHVSKLTEIERGRLRDLLMKIPRDKLLTEQQAIQALEYCATLIQDESLPNEIDRKTILTFLSRVIGAPLSKVKKKTEKTVGNGNEVKRIAVLRGVCLHLTWDDRLVAVSVSPTRVRERAGALRFVAIGQDCSSNVSREHDRYLGERITCNPLEE